MRVKAPRCGHAHGVGTCSRRLRWATAFALAFAVGPVLTAQVAPAPESLTAAFLFRFAQFVEWPPAALAGRTNVDLCVVDGGPVQSALTDLVAGERVGARDLRVRRVTDAAADSCHLLYLPAGYRGGRAMLKRLAGRPVLTVGDAETFLDDGGMVELRMVANRMRFHIDAGAADRSGLRLSAQLLRLALSVRGARS